MPRQAGMADREPCPWRIVDDVGGAFCMGAIGGGIWHSVKGARMAPAGARLIGSVSAVQARSPVLGGQFAVWGGLFACCDCTLTALRQKVSKEIQYGTSIPVSVIRFCSTGLLPPLPVKCFFSIDYYFLSLYIGGSLELHRLGSCHGRSPGGSRWPSRHGDCGRCRWRIVGLD